METVSTAGSVHTKRPGILYPVMLIAAIAVIVFSIVGIATMMGWLPTALSGSAADKAAVASGRSWQAPAASCDDCGVIEAIRALPVKGEGSGAGAVGGAVVGGGLGNQVDRGSGRAVATVIGAGAGSVTYQIRVRMNDGTIRTLHERAQPAVAIGQKVRITERGIVAAG
jgi:outer membrane lipoprotein SlyB